MNTEFRQPIKLRIGDLLVTSENFKCFTCKRHFEHNSQIRLVHYTPFVYVFVCAVGCNAPLKNE